MNRMNRRRATIGIVVLALIVIVTLIVRRVMGTGPEEGDVVTDVAVHVGTVSRATLRRYVTAYGYVEAAPATASRPAAGALISTFVGGVLTAIDCVEGSQVTRGKVLFHLDSRMAQVAVQKAQQEVDFAEKAFGRQQALVSSDGTSQRALQEAQQRLDDARSNLASAETELAYLNITAPITGTVTRLDARVGQFVDANTALAEVVDLNRLVVAAAVPVREAGGLRIGQPVLIGTDSTALHGSLAVVGRDVDMGTGTYRVQASIPSGSGHTPGQFMEVRIVTEEHPDVLVVPEVSLVTRTGEGSWIMVVDGDQAVRRPVMVGLREAGLVEVSGEGISEGTTLVTLDAYSLPAETRIHIVEG
jgi:membrane fusion protein, multidrug efflux system